ncbi:glycoside hydrolase family 88 protein [bacterium]|nr:glycoside hydrolase family 88 protein [bacterium]
MKYTLLAWLGLIGQIWAHPAEKEIVFVAANPLKSVRSFETIELDWKELSARLPGVQPDRFFLKDLNTGKLVVTQILDADADGRPDQLLFQSDFGKDDPLKTFRLAMTSTPPGRSSGRLYGRFVPERKDDFAWENDRIAFRMYGPALEAEMISSGIDVWTKRVPYPIIDKWYAAGDASYHRDSGEGLDFYNVGSSRGCGGTGIWDGQSLHVSRNFKSYRCIAGGPIRLVFELRYDPWTIAGDTISEVKRISLDAGHQFNRIESIYQSTRSLPISFAAGVAKHPDWQAAVAFSREHGWLSRWESRDDFGALGCAVILDPNALVDFYEQDMNHLIVGKATPAQAVRYYAGAGWDRSGYFNHREEWEAYVDLYAQAVQTPIQITYLTSASLRQKPKAESWAHIVARSIIQTYPNPADLDVYGKGWTYTNGFFLHGLYRLQQKEPNQEYLRYIQKWLDRYIDHDGRLISSEYKMDEYKLDDVEAGKIALLMYQRTGDTRYRRACEQLVEQLQKQPRTTEGGYWHKLVYPWQMWLDGIYMADAFLLQYAAAVQQPNWTDEAIRQIKLITAHTLDGKTGLYYHGWDEKKNPVWADPLTGASPGIWGRALGWFAMALVDGLDELDAHHPQRPQLLQILSKLSAALVTYQDPETGLWYQVVDRGDHTANWHETSCSAMFSYALARSVHQGYLPKKYLKNAEKAFQGLCRHHVYFDEQGLFYLTGTVKVGTLNFASSQGDFEYYVNTDRRINDFKGVAAFLFAALELNR